MSIFIFIFLHGAPSNGRIRGVKRPRCISQRPASQEGVMPRKALCMSSIWWTVPPWQRLCLHCLAALPFHHMRRRLMSRAPWNNVFLTGRWSPPSGRLQTHRWPLVGAECIFWSRYKKACFVCPFSFHYILLSNHANSAVLKMHLIIVKVIDIHYAKLIHWILS